MSFMTVTFDVLLVLATLSVAVLTLYHSRIFASTVLFIVYGLLLSLIWLRLSAPDVALAEAAIGAGITGVLLMGTLARLAHQHRAGAEETRRAGAGNARRRRRGTRQAS